jgi:mono/diheme cytochrome c family protein
MAGFDRVCAHSSGRSFQSIMTIITARSARKVAALTWALLAGVVLAASQTAGPQGPKLVPKPQQERTGKLELLPGGEGRALVVQACVQCHDFKNIVSQRKTPAAWRRTVDEMAWRGAPLMPGEAEVISNYLAKSLGVDKPAAQPGKDARTGDADEAKLAAYLPKGEGRALVLQSCVECHDLESIVLMRAAPGEWRRTVDKMVRLGAQVSPREAERIASYLGSSFSPKTPVPDALKKK